MSVPATPVTAPPTTVAGSGATSAPLQVAVKASVAQLPVALNLGACTGVQLAGISIGCTSPTTTTKAQLTATQSTAAAPATATPTATSATTPAPAPATSTSSSAPTTAAGLLSLHLNLSLPLLGSASINLP
ncbi:MAG: hypothetical protein ACRD0J_09240 [Acidimicrobiales bacterium]